MQDNSFEIKRFDFNAAVFNEFQDIHFVQDLWPVVYILSDGTIQEAYVGETTDTTSRMNAHLRNNAKNRLSIVHLISSYKFNKSATLDIESNLIKYISGDGQYKLLNSNIGLANHNYYQKKEIYWGIFESVWNKLRSEGVAKHSINFIDNSDLFKYSPYKSLNNEQLEGLLKIIAGLLDDSVKNILIEGGAGTGKTVLAVFLFKLLHLDKESFNFKEFGDSELEFIQFVSKLQEKYPAPRVALVVPMASFRNTLKKVFKNINGLNSNMVIGPSELANSYYDIVLVDESHRLRRRVNLGTYFHAFDVACQKLNLDQNSCSELDWVIKQSSKAILFYDENQSIKPSDAKKEDFERIKSARNSKVDYLKSQFRVKGGNGYVEYIDRLITCRLAPTQNAFQSKDYEFVIFDSVEEMVNKIKSRDAETGLSRLIAGFAWPWISKTDKALFDIDIDGYKLKWNSVTVDFINSANAIDEVGCIHTTQGYDLNYAGIIFGNEICYDKHKNEIVVLKENYFDKNGKNSIADPAELKSFILNIYRTILLRGIKGTYIYVCDKNLREYFKRHIQNAPTNLIQAVPDADELIPFVNAVPVYDLQAAAGAFSDLQEVDERDYDWVKLPERYKVSKDLFACRIVGESMNKVIPNGSLCLFRKDNGGSRNGKIVLVEHTNLQDQDSGSNYTVKEYCSIKRFENGGWAHESISLKPLSYNPGYEDILVSADEIEYFKVRGVFECVI